MKRKLFIILAVGIVLLIFAGASLREGNRLLSHEINATSEKAQRSASEVKSAAEGFHYQSMVETWNDYATRTSRNLILLDEDCKTDDALLTRLETMLSIFAEKPSDEFKTELMDIETKAKTAFQAFEDYRNQHRQEKPLSLARNRNEQEIAHRVNEYAGVMVNGLTPDFIHAKTIETIADMSSICSFFERNKHTLHKKGISNKVNRCADLKTGGAYPLLDALVDDAESK